MIRLVHVWKYYGDAVALRDLSLEIAAGEVVILTGPSGAGKSTLLRLMFGAERADQGQVLVADRDVARLRRSSIPYLRRNIGIIFQDFKLLWDRSVRDNVAVALEILGVGGYELRVRADAALAAVGLGGKEELRARCLSGGEQQRVAIARAIVGEPAIVLADEPTGNLDPVRALEVLDRFEALRSRGTTMLVATHDPDVIRFGLSHGWRRVRLDRGALVEAAPAEVLEGDPTDRVAGTGALLRLVEV